MQKMIIAVVKGVSDNRYVRVERFYKDGDIQFTWSGTTGISDALDGTGLEIRPLYLDASHTQEISVVNAHGIFNEISDPDTHRISLRKLADFIGKLPVALPVFNRPEKIINTARETIAQQFHNKAQLLVPKTIRIQPRTPAQIYQAAASHGLSLPFIFRQAGSHGGHRTIRVDTEGEPFHASALDGRDYYLTQYVDYSNNNIFRKYRLVVVGGEVFLRHLIASDSWIIHSHSREFMAKHQEFQKQEVTAFRTFDEVLKPRIQPIVQQIYTTCGLDFFGIDCSIDRDYTLTIFELNANMNIFTDTSGQPDSIWRKAIETIRDALIRLLEKRCLH